jgi:hypothetical protein
VNPFTRVEGGGAQYASYGLKTPYRHYIPWHVHRDDFVIQLDTPTFNAPLTSAPVACATHNAKLSRTYANCVLLDTKFMKEHYWMYWEFVGSGANTTIRIGLVAEGVEKGWMALGLSSDRLHTKRLPNNVVDGWIATMAGNTSHLIDANFPDELNMVVDTTNNLMNSSVSTNGNFLVAEFDRLLTTGDTAGDRVLDPCFATTTFLWATRSYPQYTTYTGGWPVVFHHDSVHRGTSDIDLLAPPSYCSGRPTPTTSSSREAMWHLCAVSGVISMLVF